MAKYFKSIKSYDDLKNQYKKLLKENHPDNGGDLEVMKEINVQYDALFQIWKNKKEAETGEEIKETADSTRNQFYTMFGWEGSNHDWNRSLKEVAKIVRAYVKEKYPTYKFSVRTSYASMCQELHVTLKESPIEIYKTFEELTSDDFSEIGKRLFMWDYEIENRLNFLNSSVEEKKKTIEESTSKYKNILNNAKPDGISYKITQGEDTRDGSILWLVRINETLTREQYLAENKAMKDRGGYYSKFRHAFIFREDPTEILKGGKVA